MFLGWLPLTIVLLQQVSESLEKPLDCLSLFDVSKNIIKDFQPYVSSIHPANVTFVPVDNPAYPEPVPDLPEFCRFGGEFNTSSTSRVWFELWLPKIEQWNGRFAFIGNGGAAGGVHYTDMGVSLRKYGFAVASTNTGHNGTSFDGTFAISNPESQIDFGHRAVHLSTIFAKAIAEQYYGRKPAYNYWIGCSSGGKQGMKSAQMHPEDFDGVIAGARDTTPGAVIPLELFGTLYQEVMSQCDGLDSVSDGIVSNPRACKPDLSRVACDSSNSSQYINSTNCFSDSQMVTLKAIYTNWTSTSGEFLFPALDPGSELGWSSTISGVLFGAGAEYFSYQVLNKTSVSQLQVNETELQRLVAIAGATDPGQINAIDPT